MNKDRIADAAVNRAAEGLRVLEDTARFALDNTETAAVLRNLRHSTRAVFTDRRDTLICARDADGDVGRQISEKSRDDARQDLRETCLANFKRVQEAFRTIEEILKTSGHYRAGKQTETMRFTLYTTEKKMMSFFRKRLPPGLYGILGEKFSRGRTNLEVAWQMADAGVNVIQYREKLTNKSLKQIYEECCDIRRITSDHGVMFIVNDFPEIARMVGADGTHAGQDDLPAADLKKTAGDMIVGISTHSPAQAEKAIEDGADYIGVGPLFETATKEDVCSPVGLDYLEWAVENVTVPFVAIGGIKRHNLPEVVKRGARTVCLVTDILEADNIPQRVEAIKAIYTETKK